MDYHGNDDRTTMSTDKNQITNVDYFETELFESQLSPSSSRGKYYNGGDDERENSGCTLLLGDDTHAEDAFETQLVTLAGETQPLDDIDGVEDINTQLLDEIIEADVFGSDDDGTDRTQVLEDVDDLSDDDAHYRGSGQSAYSNDIPSVPFAGDGEKKFLVQTDAIIDERNSSGYAVIDDHTSAESLQEAGLSARNVASNQAKGKIDSVSNTSQSQEPLSVEDGKPGCPDIVKKVDQEYDHGKWSREIEGFMNKNKSQVGSLAMRKLLNDELPVEQKGSSPRSNEGEDLANLPIYDGELAGLSYVNSQEPGDLSQANALDFIDRFLEDNIIKLDEEVDHDKNVQEKPKSLPRPSTKGQHSLAKRINDSGIEGRTCTYDWYDNCESERGEIFVRRKNLFYEGESCRQKSSPGVSKIKVSEPNEYEYGEEQLSIFNKRESAAHSDSRLLMQNLEVRDNNVQETAIKSTRILDNGCDKQLNINSSIGQLEPNAVTADAPEMLGVGLDTQMAAEAMEALCNYEGTVSLDDNGRSSLTEPPSCSASGKTRPITSKVLSRQYGRKRKLNDVKSNLHTSSSANSYTKESKQLCQRDNRMRRSKRSKLNAEHNQTSISGENDSNLPSKSIKRRTSTGVFKTPQFEGLNSGTGSLKGRGMRSVKQRHLQDGLCYFSPIASRTRQSLVINQFVKPGRPSRSFGEEYREVVSLKNRISCNGIQVSKESDLKSSIDCSDHSGMDENTKLCQLEKSSSKFSYVDNGIIVDGLEIPRRRRSLQRLSCHNKGSENLGGSSKSSAWSEDAWKSIAKKRKLRTEATRVAKSNMNGQTQSSSYSSSIISSIDRKQRKLLESILDKPNPGDTSLCPYVDKDANLKTDGKKDADFMLSAQSFEDTTSVSYNLTSSTLTNFKTAEKSASPLFMGDKYYRKSGNKNTSRSIRVKEYSGDRHKELQSPSAAGPETTTSPKDSRKRRDMTDVRVLFSHHLDDDIIKHQKKILVRLGASVASSISDATHFIADDFVRTRNMLEAIASGKPVVSHLWIESCGQACCFIDEKNYILRDARKEKEFGFSMPVSLARAFQHPLLEGLTVLITPNVKPGKDIISSLVKAVQGQAVERMGRSVMKDDKIPDDLLVLSCEEDYNVCVPFLEKGAAIYSSELLLSGIVTQKLEYERHQLFADHVKKTRSTKLLKRDGRTFFPVTKSK